MWIMKLLEFIDVCCVKEEYWTMIIDARTHYPVIKSG